MKNLFVFAITFVSVIGGLVHANDLAGTSWELSSFNGATGVVGTLEFDETMMYSKFCNNVSQGYSVTADGLVASGAGMSTMMYCEGMPMTLEGAFVLSETIATPVVMSGETLTITASGNNTFVFHRTQVLLQDLQSTCIQAYDECSNMCTREAGTVDWACTKMGCAVKKDAQCVMSTNDIDMNETICTMEYMPVCGTLGELSQTYGNACQLNAAGATYLYDGVCVSDEICIQQFDGCNTCTRIAGGEWVCTKMACEKYDTPKCLATSDDMPVVGGDEDEHGCKGSAGYSWSQSQQQCVRIWENTGASSFELAYDFSFNEGMTTMETIDAFRGSDFITRQEAAKMLVAFADVLQEAQSNKLCALTFTDESTFDPTLKSFIYDACANGMMKGAKGAFMPNDTLTQGQVLAVLMRTIDGMLTEEDTATWWMPYVERARALNLLTIDATDDFNNPITREELIVWAHTMYKNASTQ